MSYLLELSKPLTIMLHVNMMAQFHLKRRGGIHVVVVKISLHYSNTVNCQLNIKRCSFPSTKSCKFLVAFSTLNMCGCKMASDTFQKTL